MPPAAGETTSPRTPDNGSALLRNAEQFFEGFAFQSPTIVARQRGGMGGHGKSLAEKMWDRFSWERAHLARIRGKSGRDARAPSEACFSRHNPCPAAR